MTTSTTWAVQPADWFNFDPHGADYCLSIDHAYRVAALSQPEDMMIWRINGNGEPIRWVRVYGDENVSSMTVAELSHLV